MCINRPYRVCQSWETIARQMTPVYLTLKPVRPFPFPYLLFPSQHMPYTHMKDVYYWDMSCVSVLG